MTGPKEVTAADIIMDADVEILNPDMHIATLDKDGSLYMEITVERGRGHVLADKNKETDMPIGVIPVDSLHLCAKSTLRSKNSSVGQITDYDKPSSYGQTVLSHLMRRCRWRPRYAELMKSGAIRCLDGTRARCRDHGRAEED